MELSSTATTTFRTVLWFARAAALLATGMSGADLEASDISIQCVANR
jgi:hypothetical protein